MSMSRISAILAVSALAAAGANASAAFTWNAGQDFKANELSVNELTNPNATVPEWSYGWRTGATSTSLVLFGPGGHLDSGFGGDTDIQGWTGGGTTLQVNTGTVAKSGNFGFGIVGPVNPSDLLLHPAASGDVVVVRFTAPFASDYAISADWRDIDPYGGDGVSALLVRGGSAVFNQSIDSTSTSLSPTVLSLAAGEFIDFVVAPNGDYFFDSTTFNARISVIPEPAALALLAPAAVLLRRLK